MDSLSSLYGPLTSVFVASSQVSAKLRLCR